MKGSECHTNSPCRCRTSLRKSPCRWASRTRSPCRWASRTRSPCRWASPTRSPCRWASRTKTPCDGGSSASSLLARVPGPTSQSGGQESVPNPQQRPSRQLAATRRRVSLSDLFERFEAGRLRRPAGRLARGDRQHDHSPTRGPQGLTDGILILGSGGAVPGAPPEPFKLLARRHGHVPDTARTRQAADLYVRGGRHAGEREELGAGSGAVRSVPSRAEVTVVAPRADGALGHAGVLGLQHHADAAGAEIGVEALGDLHRQPLLWVWGRAAKRSTGRAS